MCMSEMLPKYCRPRKTQVMLNCVQFKYSIGSKREKKWHNTNNKNYNKHHRNVCLREKEEPTTKMSTRNLWNIGLEKLKPSFAFFSRGRCCPYWMLKIIIYTYYTWLIALRIGLCGMWNMKAFTLSTVMFQYLVFTCAPVNVAISKIIVALRSFCAYATPSASTKRPSASVLLISTVRPEYSLWISSGLC